MAAVSDCFSLGSIVWCRTCYDTEIEGEVMAFDAPTKVLILKCPSSCGNAKLNDIQFINLSLVSELSIKKEVTTPPELPQSLNIERLNTRIKNQVEETRRILQARSTNASIEGQSVFIAIAKTLGVEQKVRWSNSEIVVYDEVVISPPYQLENIKGDPNNKGFNYIKKIVEKYWNDTLNSQNAQSNIVHNDGNGNFK